MPLTDFYFTIMVVSTQTFCERLKQCILRTSDKLYNREVKVKLAENVADVLNSEDPNTKVDFVAIVVDTSVANALEKYKRDISLIMPHILASRLCIINGSCRNCDVDLAKDLIEFADTYSLPYFNGHVMDNLSCRVTAERILKLAAHSSGYDSGIPGIIPIPRDIDFFSFSEDN